MRDIDPRSGVVSAVTTDGVVAEPANAPGTVTTGRPRSRVVVALLAAVVGLVLGGLIGASVRVETAARTAVAPTSTPMPPGDFVAAAKWFAAPEVSPRQFPQPGALTSLGVDPASVRLVLSDATAGTLWIGKTSQDFCLIWTGRDQESATAQTTCATPTGFTRSGLSLAVHGRTYSWDGRTFSLHD